VASLDDWKLCPRCGAALERGEGRATCANGHDFYANPDPTACALCVDDRGHILLARRAHAPFEGFWDIPGGFIEEDEHPHDAIRRELREETGLEVEPRDFVGAWIDRYSEDGAGNSTLNLYWTATAGAGEPVPADDVSELRWFPPGELPPREELAFHTAAVLSAWRDEHA